MLKIQLWPPNTYTWTFYSVLPAWGVLWLQGSQELRVSKTPIQIVHHSVYLPPSVIMYDNACQLHTYALNREPQRFKRTLFAVDRFHWRGLVGCSSGYNLHLYSVHKSLNSQVNEQANARLQHIKSQLAYMTFDNFVFHLCLFLSIKNRGAQRKIDVSCLSI